MSNNYDFSVVIPIFNESENIIELLNEIQKNLKSFYYEIILIDDFSNDDTIHKINNYNKKNIELIKNSKNLGQSKSILKGVKIAKAQNIITLDGDGQNDPSDIPKLFSVYNSNDVGLVSGLRLNRKDSFIKKFSSKIANKIRSFILNDDCIDTGCALKIFNKNYFLEMHYFNGIHRFLPALFKGYGHKVMFVSVNHRFRKYGKSKYGILKRLFVGIFDIVRVLIIIKFKK